MYIIASSLVAKLTNSYKLTIKLSVSFPMYFAISDSFISPSALRTTIAGKFLNLLKAISNIPLLSCVNIAGIL